MPNIHMKTKLLMMFRYLIIMTLGLKKNKGGLRRCRADKLFFLHKPGSKERNGYFDMRFEWSQSLQDERDNAQKPETVHLRKAGGRSAAVKFPQLPSVLNSAALCGWSGGAVRSVLSVHNSHWLMTV